MISLVALLALQAKVGPSLWYEWLVQSVDGTPVKNGLTKPFFFVALAPNGVFKSEHYVRIDKQSANLFEAYGNYSIRGDQIVFRYRGQEKTPYHDQFGPGMTTKCTPPQDLTFIISQPAAHTLVLSNKMGSYMLSGDHAVTKDEPWWMTVEERRALKKRSSK